MVTQVHVPLPGRQGFLAHLVQRDHHLDVARAIPDSGEAQLAAAAVEHHPARDANPLAGRYARSRIAEALPQVGDGRRPRKVRRVRFAPRGPDGSDLREPDSHLLRQAASSLRLAGSPLRRATSVLRRAAGAGVVRCHLPEVTGARPPAATQLLTAAAADGCAAADSRAGDYAGG